MKRILSMCFGIAAFASLSAQCSLIEVPLAQRASASILIVEGKVSSQSSYWNSTHTMIYTTNTIDLYKIFKGNVTGTSIEIITEGGTVGLDKITVEPTLELQVGEIGMFTCTPVTRAKNLPVSRGGLPRFEAYASIQGFVKYNDADQTASDPFRTYSDLQADVYNVCAPAGHHQYTEVQPYNFSAATQRSGDPQVQAGPSISSLSPTTITAGTGSVLTINGSNFGVVQSSSVVRFKNADDGGATTVTPLASQYLSWSSNQITVEVPQNAGTGVVQVFINPSTATSSQTLTISYAHLNVDFDPGTGTEAYQTDHVNDDGSGGYTWHMNTAFDAATSERASFMRAYDSWRCATGVFWSIGSTTSIDDAQSDGTNVITNDDNAQLSAGILGVCYSYWSGCASGPTIIWYVNELDIIFDDGSNITPLTWQYGPSAPSGSQYDFETVAVHELGHGHQLGHVISPGAIMHYAISNGTQNRSLGANDLAGGQFVQAKSVVTNICGPGAMSNFSCGSAPVAAFIGSPTTVCAGGSVSFTDNSTNTPTSWSWICPGGTPSSSNAQNPTITYNTPGTYNVSLTATNASGSNSVTITSYITVNALPTVGFSSSPASPIVCAGQQVTLSGSGATSYNWTGGITNGVAFTPPGSASYTVTGTDGNGCTNTAVASVTVNPSPTVNITTAPSNSIVCTGGQATLTATGAQSYSWTGGITNGVAFVPPATTTYTLTATGSNGCTSTASRTITVQSCSGPVSTVPCGQTIAKKNQYLSAANVVGATQYRFTFYDNVTLAQVSQVTQASRTLTFTSVPGIYYGTTYRWTVAVNTGSGFGAESSTSCTITFAVPQTTVGCGVTYNSFGVTGAAVLVPGTGLLNYVFRIYNSSTNALITTYNSTSQYIPFNQVTGIAYGNTYKWTVQVKYATSASTSAFGPESSMNCLLTFSAPVTTVPCNGTFNRNTGHANAAQISGATGYRFTFYQSSVQVAQRAQASNYLYFTNVTSGIANGQTYQWTVEVQYNNGSGLVYGPASAPCNITFSSSARMAAEEESDPAVDPMQPGMTSFAILMYPNPLGDGMNPTISITGADQQQAIVTVIDLTGRVITTYQLQVEGDEYTTELTEFPELVAGMYIMQVQVGDEIHSQRFVAE